VRRLLPLLEDGPEEDRPDDAHGDRDGHPVQGRCIQWHFVPGFLLLLQSVGHDFLPDRHKQDDEPEQYKYRVKEKEYPFTMALGTRRMSPAKGARVILCFVLGVGMHQRIAATWTMVTTPAMRTQPSLDT
jgi:hypothetical protein